MERVSQTIGDTLYKRYIDSRVNISQDSESFNFSYKHSLKYAILNEPSIFAQTISSTGYSIFEGDLSLPCIDGPALDEAKYTDFMLGSYRVKVHYEDLKKAKKADLSSAWLLVTAYYCCYFSCLELLKMQNVFLMSFDAKDINELHRKLIGMHKFDFVNKNNKNFIGRVHAGQIKFQSSSDKPHQLAWIELKKIINSIFTKENWPELWTIERILTEPLLNPSVVRNNWNYKRADYFGIAGESLNFQLKKLISNPPGAVKWLEQNNQSGNTDDGCRIVALCEVLAPAIIDARERLSSFKN